MLFKFLLLLSCLALVVIADNSIESALDPSVRPPTETRVESSVSFETSHKRPDDIAHDNDDDDFQTSHKIGLHKLPSDIELNMDTMNDFANLQTAMNLLPTKERPELNPILSALINEDVMKSIEAKRAIEQEELEFIRSEVEQQATAAAGEKEGKIKEAEEKTAVTTEAGVFALTTAAPVKKIDLDDDINVGFVDQTINLDAAGSENNKKSRIEIKKGPNGQDYEYEYVYYYEEDDDDSKAKPSETVVKAETDTARGKSRYSNIDRSTTASAADNSLVNTKAKGRSSNVEGGSAGGDDDIDAERLPNNTRFPSRKSIETQPTPALDSLENAAEKKKISVKRPSLELVDSETFNTDEKQVKGTRNGDTEAKSAIAIEQEQAKTTAAAAAAEAAARAVAEKPSVETKTDDGDEESATEKSDNNDDVEQTTPSMEKAALDLYAILANENFNLDMTTDADMDVTTLLPDTTNEDGGLTTLLDEESSSTTSTTTTTTTTTTEAPTTTTTTTTTTTAAPLFGGRRHGAGLPASGRNRFKLKQGGAGSTTTSTTEAPSAEPPKTGKNRFSRPSIGGRNRASFKTTSAPAAPPAAEEEEVAVKEVKPVSSGFGRGRPRNRFNLRGSTTTEKPSGDAEEAAAQEEIPSSTTARTLRSRPTLNLRGRSRTTTTKAPASEDSSDDEAASAEKASAPAPSSSPVRPSRFNIQRPGGNRLLPRGKLGRTTEAPATSDDSAADSSHHNDVKGEGSEDNVEKGEPEAAPAAPQSAGGLNRLKSRSRLNNNLQKTDNSKPKVAPAPIAPRKINPLLAKRRLQLGHSTTETAAVEDDSSTAAEESEAKDETTSEENENAAKDDATEVAETTTKQQPRGLGLLGQRRRLPARKPGTIL